MTMLPRADLNLPRPRTTVDSNTPAAPATPVTPGTPVGDARQDVFRRLTQIAIGKELQVMVDSMLDDGNFLVKVADTTARMALPQGTRAGDVLSMVFIAKEPRPTFLLNQQGGSAPATLSDAARLIGQVLHSASQQGKPAVLEAQQPLLPTPPTSTQQVADALQDGLNHSGLFYESHLQEWVQGSRSLQDLSREPQAQQAAGGKTPQGGSELARLADQARDAGGEKLAGMLRDALPTSANPRGTDADVLARSDSMAPAIDPEAARMISLQLNALETQQVRWQGELWPGQPMEWEVSEDAPERSPSDVQEPVWNSKVRFELPHLGAVSASIRLVGNSVQVQVEAADDAAAESLRRHGDGLAARIEASGASLDSLLVKRNEQA
ncbi:flagellar hook-length control protein FliK [Noviherbaspirillum sp. CPCC 100848]|uniref:Flagellar hook-length control protein FliK n=1 Tax=Noviherbaspirillum album TaxID=3080276 RepID=A0ABU6JCU3_9BURK|nr:flagellar hook-length control protein FliK [Noviherbaspirillum sp. CPCC 100848]MEC4721348.1 flagellar hook-length control protein FliK [Noviherbaspirillum sp. CPCC 100848]